jgi:hypothetical protein
MSLFDRIEQLIKQHGSLRAAGRAIKVDPAYLLRLHAGTKTEPSDKVLRKLGLRRVVTYKLYAGDNQP